MTATTEPDAPAPAKPVWRSRAFVPILIAALAGILVVLYAWRLPPFRTALQTTDNAFVRGPVTMISPKIDGYVAEVLVQDFQQVEEGQLLVRIDDRIPRQQLAQAEATLAAQDAGVSVNQQQQRTAKAAIGQADAQVAGAQAALIRAQADAKRTETLFKGGWVAQDQVDQTRAALRAAEAALAEAEAGVAVSHENVAAAQVGRGGAVAGVENAHAAVELARINLQNTKITAPQAGRLGEVGVRVGQYVTPGSSLMSVVPDQVWIVANFKETQMANIRVGQPATIRVDALNRATLHGHVERLSPATGSEFSVLRPENAAGNFTKIAQRIPVRIRLDPDQPLIERLSPGMSVTVSVDTSTN